MRLLTPKPYLSGLLVVAALLLLGACATQALLPSELRMSAVELTTRMEKRFPVERNIAGLIEVKFSRPVVTLEAPRMSTQFDVEVKVPLSGKTSTGTLAVSGEPRYDPATRGMFLKEARVERLALGSMPDALSDALAKLASQVAKAQFEDRPFHTFKEEDFTKFGIGYTPQALDVRGDALVLTLRK